MTPIDQDRERAEQILQPLINWAGAEYAGACGVAIVLLLEDRVVPLIAAALAEERESEREACARMAEELGVRAANVAAPEGYATARATGSVIARAIRRRGGEE